MMSSRVQGKTHVVRDDVGVEDVVPLVELGLEELLAEFGRVVLGRVLVALARSFACDTCVVEPTRVEDVSDAARPQSDRCRNERKSYTYKMLIPLGACFSISATIF